jgi:hypothetical protein
LIKLEIEDRAEKIVEAARLVSLLPLPNYASLRSLLGHLLRIVQKSDINKMTVRNMSIVFSPTLGLPAGVFTLLLAEFSSVFIWKPLDLKRGIEMASSPVLQSTGIISHPKGNADSPSLPEIAVVEAVAMPDTAPVTFMSDDIQGLVPVLTIDDHINNILKASTPPGGSTSALVPKDEFSPNSGTGPDMMKALKDQLDDLEKS